MRAPQCFPELFKWEEKSDKVKMQCVGKPARVPPAVGRRGERRRGVGAGLRPRACPIRGGGREGGKIMNERLRPPGREVRQMNEGEGARTAEALGVSHQVRERARGRESGGARVADLCYVE